MRGDILLTIGTRLVIVALSVVTGVLTARLLGPEGRGEYFFIVTFAAIVCQFGNLGLHASNTYHVAREPAHLPGLTANSLWISIVVGGILAVVAVGLVQAGGWFPDVSPTHLWIGAALVPVNLFFMLGSNLLVGSSRFGAYNALEIGSRLLIVVAMAAAGVLALGVGGFLAASVLAWGVTGVVLLVILLRRHGFDLSVRKDLISLGMRYAGRAYVVALLGFLVLRGNVFILQRQLGSEELGYYSIAIQIADMMAILPASVALVIFPALVRAERRGWGSTMTVLRRTGLLLAVACLGVAVLAKPFVTIAFGTEFLPSVPVVLWILPGVFCLGLTSVVSQYLAAAGFPWPVFAVWGGALVLVIASNAVLIPAYASVGAAMALSFSYMVLFFAMLVLGWGVSRQAPEALGKNAAEVTS